MQANLSRNISVDILKAIAIFGVVWIHGAACLGCDSRFYLYVSWLFRFGVPCFIGVWAYFFAKSYSSKTKKQRLHYIKMRFIHLLTVFLFWSLLYWLVYNRDFVSVFYFLTHAFNGYVWSGQYFFIILFQLTLLFPVLRYCYRKRIYRYILLCICGAIYFMRGYFFDLFPTVINKLGDEPFIYWIPYVFAGMALAEGDIKIRISHLFYSSVLLIPIEFYLLKTNNLQHSEYITPIVLLVSIIITIITIQYNTIHS